MRSTLLLALALFSTGCAAIFGTKQKAFDLQSNPSGADVYLDGARLGTTPLKSQLSNQKEHTFVFRKAGYKEVSCTLARGTGGGWVVLDILAGLVPVIIDAATNSWSQTKGSGCVGSLQPLDEATPAPAVAVQPTDGAATSSVRGSAPTPSPQPPQTAVSGVPSEEEADPPVAGYDRLPPGVNYVGDVRIKVYYPLGCAAQHAVPVDAQVFFQTAGGAETDGFKRSGDC